MSENLFYVFAAEKPSSEAIDFTYVTNARDDAVAVSSELVVQMGVGSIAVIMKQESKWGKRDEPMVRMDTITLEEDGSVNRRFDAPDDNAAPPPVQLAYQPELLANSQPLAN